MPILVFLQCLRLALYLISKRVSHHFLLAHPRRLINMTTVRTPVQYQSIVESLPDGVAGPKTNPLWDGSILLLSPCELLLGAEGFVGLYHHTVSIE